MDEKNAPDRTRRVVLFARSRSPWPYTQAGRLERAGVILRPQPADATDPQIAKDDEVDLGIHFSQVYETAVSDNTGPYKEGGALEAVIAGIESEVYSGPYPLHHAWALAHRLKIKSIRMITGGVKQDMDKRVTEIRAAERLAKRGVVFWYDELDEYLDLFREPSTRAAIVSPEESIANALIRLQHAVANERLEAAKAAALELAQLYFSLDNIDLAELLAAAHTLEQLREVATEVETSRRARRLDPGVLPELGLSIHIVLGSWLPRDLEDVFRAAVCTVQQDHDLAGAFRRLDDDQHDVMVVDLDTYRADPSAVRALISAARARGIVTVSWSDGGDGGAGADLHVPSRTVDGLRQMVDWLAALRSTM